MKLTITGATGRVGAPLTRWLAQAGHEVRAVDRTYSRDLGVPLEMADLTDPLVAYRVIEGAEAVIHLATPNAQHITLDLFGPTLAMNMNVFQAAADVGVTRIVYASSIQAISGTRRATEADEQPSQLAYLPLDGLEPYNPRAMYGFTKVLGEQQLAHICRQPGMSGVALRLPGIWNANHAGVAAGRRRIEQLGTAYIPDEAFTWLHVDDVGRLIDAILRADLPGFRTYLPASPIPAVADPVPAIIERLYPDVPLRRPLSELSGLVDLERITRETGWLPQSPSVPVAS